MIAPAPAPIAAGGSPGSAKTCTEVPRLRARALPGPSSHPAEKCLHRCNAITRRQRPRCRPRRTRHAGHARTSAGGKVLRPPSALSTQRDLCPRGLELDRSTPPSPGGPVDSVGHAAWLLDPVVAAFHQHVFAAKKIHGDDTTVPVLAPGLDRTKHVRRREPSAVVYVRDDQPFLRSAPPAAAYFYSRTVAANTRRSHGRDQRFLQADRGACLGACGRPRLGRGVAVLGPPTRPANASVTEAGAFSPKSSMSGKPRNRRSPRKRSIGSQRSMSSRPGPIRPCRSGSNTARNFAAARSFFTSANATVVKLSANAALAEAFRYTIKRRKAPRALSPTNVSRPITTSPKRHARHRGGAEEPPVLWLRYRRRSCSFHPPSRADGKARRRKSRDIPQGYPDEIADGPPINRINELMPSRMLPLPQHNRNNRRSARTRQASVCTDRR